MISLALYFSIMRLHCIPLLSEYDESQETIDISQAVAHNSHSPLLTLLAVSVATAAVAPRPPEVINERNVSLLESDVDIIIQVLEMENQCS